MQISLFLRCFPYHRSPLQGTHGDRVAGDNTRSRHNLRHFSYCATSPAWQLRNRTPRILVLFVKSDARFGRRRCGSDYVRANSILFFVFYSSGSLMGQTSETPCLNICLPFVVRVSMRMSSVLTTLTAPPLTNAKS